MSDKRLVIPAGLCKAEQMGLFGGMGAPRPPGSGWMIIPRGKHGGYRRHVGQGWEYWYPTHGLMSKPHPDEPPEVHAEHAAAEAKQQAAQPASEPKKPKVMNLEQFAAATDGVTGADVQGHIHAGLRSKPKTKTYQRFFDKKLEDLRRRRDETEEAYRAAIANGEIVEPPKTTTEEVATSTSESHPGISDTQRAAAQRILERRKARAEEKAKGEPPKPPEEKKPEEPKKPKPPPPKVKLPGGTTLGGETPEFKLTVPTGAAEPKARRFETAGKKIGGSRADLAGMRMEDLEKNPQLARSLVTKSNVLGIWKPAWAEADRDNDVTSACSWAKKEIFDSVAGQPYDDPDIRDYYRQGCTRLLDGLARCKTQEDIETFLMEWRDAAIGRKPAEPFHPEIRQPLNSPEERYSDLYKRWKAAPSWGRSDMMREAGVIGWREYPDGRVAALKADQDVHVSRYQEQVSRAARMKAPVYKLMTAALGNRFAELVGFQVRRSYGQPAIGLVGYPGDDKINTKGRKAFDASWKAAGYAGPGGEHLDIDDWAWLAKEQGKKTEKKEKPKMESENREDSTWVWTRRTEPVERKGPPVPPPKDSIEFMKSFGLPGVEYGNWANDAEREWHVTSAHAGLYDLAEVLDISPAKLGIVERLSLAFGARGSGGKRAPVAHYEPGKQVINITKLNGAGSLAHEWGHFLDNAIMMAAAKATGSTSGKAKYLSEELGGRGVEDEVAAAMGKVMHAIKYEEDTRTPEQKDQERKDLSEKLESIRAELDMEDEHIRQLNRQSPIRKVARAPQPGEAGYEEFRAAAAAHSKKYEEVIAGRNKLAREHNEILRKRRSINEPQETEHFREAKKLAKGNYYCKDVELWARAFESYVEDTLIGMGRKSGYLVHGTAAPAGQRTKAAGRAEGKEVGIYMEPGEPHRLRTNAAIAELVKVLHKHDQFSKALAWSAWFKSIVEGPPLVIP